MAKIGEKKAVAGFHTSSVVLENQNGSSLCPLGRSAH